MNRTDSAGRQRTHFLGSACVLALLTFATLCTIGSQAFGQSQAPTEEMKRARLRMAQEESRRVEYEMAQQNGFSDSSEFVPGAFESATLIAVLLIVAGLWKTFTKAGQPGWGVLVPIYNYVLLLRIAEKSKWWLIPILLCTMLTANPFVYLLLFVSPVTFLIVMGLSIPTSLVLTVLISLGVARNFGRTAGFGTGLAFVPFVFYPILGFGDSHYKATPQDGDHRISSKRKRILPVTLMTCMGVVAVVVAVIFVIPFLTGSGDQTEDVAALWNTSNDAGIQETPLPVPALGDQHPIDSASSPGSQPVDSLAVEKRSETKQREGTLEAPIVLPAIPDALQAGNVSATSNVAVNLAGRWIDSHEGEITITQKGNQVTATGQSAEVLKWWTTATATLNGPSLTMTHRKGQQVTDIVSGTVLSANRINWKNDSYWTRVPSSGDVSKSPPRIPKTAQDAPPLAIAPFDAEQAKKHQQTWAMHLGVPVEKDVSVGRGQDGKDVNVTMVLIPPGEFLMGSSLAEQEMLLEEAKGPDAGWALSHVPHEGPQHPVRITRPFYLGKYEVTQAQWQSVMGSNPSEFQSDPTNPVEQISWNESQGFIDKLNKGNHTNDMTFFLPTEAQWEYSCRAGTVGIRHGGKSVDDLGNNGWFTANSGSKTHPAGQLAPNAFGVYDLVGNVYEFVADWYVVDYYAKSPKNDPGSPSTGSHRVARGGDWKSHARYCRSAFRGAVAPGQRVSYGFRLAAALSDDVNGAEFPAIASKPAITIERSKRSPPIQSIPRLRSVDLSKLTSPSVEPAGWALAFDGQSARLTAPHIPFDQYQTFTIEAWVCGWQRDILTQGIYGDPENSVWLAMGTDQSSPHHSCGWESGPGTNYQIPAGAAADLLDWNHLALVYDGQLQSLYVNGKLVQRRPASAPRPLDQSRRLSFGIHDGNPPLHGSGLLGPVRISNTVRYTQPFTPSREFTTDAETVLLYEMSEAQGTQLRDASGNKRDGIITGAEWRKANEIYSLDLTHAVITDATLAPLKLLKDLERLSLEGADISEAGLMDLTGLVRLRSLDLHKSNITDAKLGPIKSLKGLVSLSLDETFVGDTGLENIEGLNKLQSLSLAKCARITDSGLKNIEKLTELRVLDLDRAQVTDAGLEHLARMSKLDSLNLNWTRVQGTGLKHVATFQNLHRLDLAGTQLTDDAMMHIKGLNNLDFLWLTNARVTDAGLAHLAGHKRLETLILYGTQVTDTGMDHLKGLLALRHLDVRGTRVTAAAVAKLRQALPNCEILSNVRTIGVPRPSVNRPVFRQDLSAREQEAIASLLRRGARILPGPDGKPNEVSFHPEAMSDQDIEDVSALATLKKVSLGHTYRKDLYQQQRSMTYRPTEVTSNGIGFLTRLPGLEELVILRIDLSDDSLEQIGKLTNLKSFSVCPRNVAMTSGSNFTDRGIKALTGLTKLELLSLGGCQKFTDRGLTDIVQLPHLKSLNLSSTNVTDTGVAELQQSKTLEELNLHNCRFITDKGLGSLSTISQLRDLQLGGTRITDAGIQKLVALSNLEVLWMNSTPVSDKGISHLKLLKKLQSLNLFGTKVTDDCIQTLQELTDLKYVNILRTGVTPAGAGKLKGILAKASSI